MGARIDDLIGPRFLLDGGMGTALSGRGLDITAESSASWNGTHPDIVSEIHRSFVEAGAGAIHTNTFTANPWQLAPNTRPFDGRDLGSAPRFVEINIAAAELAIDAADGAALVIGDIGPSGVLPPPEGDADVNLLEEVFAIQAAALASGGVDLLHLETFYHPKEARAALRGCRAGAPELPVIASMACRHGSSSIVTSLGLPWRGLLRAFTEEGADAVGVNCAMSPSEMLPLISDLVQLTDLPLVAQPTIAPDGGAPLYPGEFAAGLLELLETGARAVGGCCGTSAHDIASARLSLEALPATVHKRPTAPIGSADVTRPGEAASSAARSAT